MGDSGSGFGIRDSGLAMGDWGLAMGIGIPDEG
jgi:hypothetical protein